MILNTIFIYYTFIFQSGSYKWVDADKLKLNIFPLERNPFTILKFFDLNRVFDFVKNGVFSRRFRLANFMVEYGFDSKNSTLLEHPLT